MTTIPIELVRPFLAVAEHGSFSAAATRLGVEKSSVSRAVARLEDLIGERLLFRTTRRVSLTDAGQAARDRLREPYTSLDAAMRSVLETAQAPRGRIVLTAPGDFGAVVLTDVLARFARRYPLVEVDVRISGRYLDLATSRIDAAIRLSMGRLRDSSMPARKIGETPGGLYASPAYVEARGLPRTPDEARAHSWVVFPAARDLRLVGPDGATAKVAMQGRVSCDDMGFVLHAALNGLGIGMLPHFLAEAELRQGRLVPVLPRWSLGMAHIWWVTPSRTDKPNAALTALRNLLVEVLAARNMGVAR
jgi:DNA-binding transcriptional LysR family regulator